MQGVEFTQKRTADEYALEKIIDSEVQRKGTDKAKEDRFNLAEKLDNNSGSAKSRKLSNISDASSTERILTCLKLKSTPFKSKAIDIYRNPYYVKQHRKKSFLKRFYYNQLKVHPFSYILAFILILIAVVFGSLNIMSYFAVDTSVCENSDTQMIYYLEYFKNFTNYSEAIALNNKTQAIFLEFFLDANESYGEDSFNDAGIYNMSWPEPYQMRYILLHHFISLFFFLFCCGFCFDHDELNCCDSILKTKKQPSRVTQAEKMHAWNSIWI